MPVNLNAVNQKWFSQKAVDTNGDSNVSREELFAYTQKAALKNPNDQTWDEALAGQLCKSYDGNGGKSIYNSVSNLYGDKKGLSSKDLGLFTGKDGKADEIAGADVKALTNEEKTKASAPTPQSAPNSSNDKPIFNQGKPPCWSKAHKNRVSGGIDSDSKQDNKMYEVKQGDTMWNIASSLSKQEGGYYSDKKTHDIVKDLSASNKIASSSDIKSGQSINIKTKETKGNTQQSVSVKTKTQSPKLT